MSDDGTRDIISTYASKHPFIHLLDNVEQTVPPALNMAVRVAKGDPIILMGAHSLYGNTYISSSVKYLQERSEVVCVGGPCVTMPGSKTALARSIARALSHPFGVGNSYFRIGVKESHYVDTVPFGCYRRQVFSRVGGFDEDLVRGVDAEFNARIVRCGGKILLAPEIVSYYHARDSLATLWSMHFWSGYFKPLLVKKVGRVFTFRQLVPPAFLLFLVLSLGLSVWVAEFSWLFQMAALLYLTVCAAFTVVICIKERCVAFALLPVVFVAMHLGYGSGYLAGVWDFLLLRKQQRREAKDSPFTR